MTNSAESDGFKIRPAVEADTPLILHFIRKLAEYENKADEVLATEAELREMLFGGRPMAEVIIGEADGEAVGFALFFHNFSTFLGRPGLYLEDIFIDPAHRGKSHGRAMMVHLARLARERNCARFEWSVLNWNESAIGFYQKLGAAPKDEWELYQLTGEALERLAK
ncbi:MAG: GNAT family N-acetyltransferase [SAR324 cluster bacterium]|nr:GNAT family N-acetyltransferase [SAR324 cluster bacterium]